MIRVFFVFGTRPEAIKLCPLIHELRSRPHDFAARVCVTAQHRDMLDQVLEALEITPDHESRREASRPDPFRAHRAYLGSA